MQKLDWLTSQEMLDSCNPVKSSDAGIVTRSGQLVGLTFTSNGRYLFQEIPRSKGFRVSGLQLLDEEQLWNRPIAAR